MLTQGRRLFGNFRQGCGECLFWEPRAQQYTLNVTCEGYIAGSVEKELTAEAPKATDVDVVLELDYTGVDAIFEGGATVDVYSVDGVLVKKGAVKADSTHSRRAST